MRRAGQRFAHIEVQGVAADGFEGVRTAFEENLRERNELGAAFAAYRDGVPVVDLWGGLADRASGRAWQRDCLQLVFSGTKGLVAVCVLLLIERGQLALDDRVAQHWPEFGAAGKEDVRVRDLVAHTAGLPGLAVPVSSEDIIDGGRMAAMLAAQPQSDDPRAAGCYHPLTFGWLVGELVRRVDGRSVGRVFADDVAVPLSLETWIGLPAEHEPRVTTIEVPEDDEPAPVGDALWTSTWANPPIWGGSAFPFNSRLYHACELPGVNGISTARSLARLYGCLAAGGSIGGVRVLAPETIELGRRILSHRHDAFGDVPMAFGVGFRVQTAAQELGPVESAFGHTGAGGSVHGAWPELRVGFSYAMNRMRGDAHDGRAAALLDALAAAVRRP